MTDNYAELSKSIHSGDVAVVRRILQRDPSCAKKRYQGGKTALHLVYDHVNQKDPIQADDRLPIIKILLENGADINAPAWYSNGMRPLTPLVIAVDKQQVNGVKFLLQNGANICITYHGRSYTALHSAVSKQAINNQIIKLLLKYKADPNAIDEDYNHTPLTKAVRKNRLDVVKILVEAGSQVNTVLKYGESALLWACKNQNLEIIEYLISHGAKMDMDNQYLLLHTPLHAIADSRDSISTENTKDMERIITLLVQQGVDINGRNYEHNTALHIASEKEDEYMVQALLKAGAHASINIQNKDKETPLHLLLANDKYWMTDSLVLDRIAKLLIKSGTNLTIRNNNGLTPLNLAVKNSHKDIVNMVLAKIAGLPESSLKCEVKMRHWISRFGKNCEILGELSVAAILGYENVVDRLISMGYLTQPANEICGKKIKPPLDCAVEANRYGTGKILLEAGCRVDRKFRWYTPSYTQSDYDKTDLRLSCLLWEYTDISILRESLKWYFEDILEEEYSLIHWGQLLNLLVLYFAINLYVGKEDINVIIIKQIFASNAEISSILNSCKEKLNILKKVRVCGDLTRFDILSMKLDSLVKLLHSKNILAACKALSKTIKNQVQIECDEYIMMTRINLAIEKKKLFELAKIFLDQSLKRILQTINYVNLPDHITFNILTNLNIRDLKIIATRVKEERKSSKKSDYTFEDPYPNSLGFNKMNLQIPMKRGGSSKGQNTFCFKQTHLQNKINL